VSVVGRALPHESALEHATGAALFTDDLAARLPGVLSAWPVTAPHAHARVLALDAHDARGQPGVAAVLTADDVPGLNDTGLARRDEPLFPSVVQYHGQPVAWVVAASEEAARVACVRVRVEYEPLPAVLDIDAALRAESWLTDELRLTNGDAQAALDAAPRRLAGELRVPGQEHFYLEPQTALASQDESGLLLVHAATQHPAQVQDVVARVLGVGRHRVVVQALRLGGAFGGKEVQAAPFAAVAALGAWRCGRPVRVRLSRALDFTLTGKRHPFLGRFEVGFDGDGRLLALRLRLWSDGGWCLDLSEPVLQRALLNCDNAYAVPVIDVAGRVCRTHTASNTAFRGFGGPQGSLMIEECLDRVARTLGLPPDEVRRRNLYRAGARTHYGQPVDDAERLERLWDELAREGEQRARRARIDAWNAGSADVKRGLALTPVKFGIAFTTAFLNQAAALVLVYADGSVQVNHGGVEMGQGLHTKVRQVAAQALGVPLEAVLVMPTRTDKLPNTTPSAASSSFDLNGAAVQSACETLRARLAALAAEQLGRPGASIVFADGRVFVAQEPGQALSFAELARRAHLRRVPLWAGGFQAVDDVDLDARTLRGRAFSYFTYGAALAEVELCGLTGTWRARRVDIIQDAGTSPSPLVDRGQVEGAFLQGLGWLTLEQLVRDERGALLTLGASTYKLPGVGERPERLNVRFLERARNPGGVYGSKGVGEAPLLLAFAVREALRDAVAAFGARGVIDLPCPSTPEVLLGAVARARGRPL
jgi:xanthine dehydrogenase large subunit